MDLTSAEKLVKLLISQHIDPEQGEVKGPVRFQWSRGTKALGTYEVRRKHTGTDPLTLAPAFVYTRTITLSRPMTAVCDEVKVRETILHEIAHARAGIRANHGPAWARECNLLGIVPQVCGGTLGVDVPLPLTGVRSTCRVCGKTHWRARMPAPGKRYACGECRGRADFLQRELTWRRGP